MDHDSTNSVGIVQTHSVRVVEADAPLPLKCGKRLGPIDVAYETYGTLNDRRDNVILICHALSGNAHAAGLNSPEDRKPGWWDTMIGPGKPIDTDQYFVICSNVLGGCSGTTGPSELNPATGKPYGLEFPIITIEDFVTVQKLLLDKLGIEHLLAVIGGSMGGMQVLQWAVSYPDFLDAAICIASTTRLNAQSIAFDAVGRNAILADPHFHGGQYHGHAQPIRGLSHRPDDRPHHLPVRAVHAGKIRPPASNRRRLQLRIQQRICRRDVPRLPGQMFIERFDANSYLYITKAMDYFDLTRELRHAQAGVCQRSACRFLIVSFSSDWLFTPGQSEEIVSALGTERQRRDLLQHRIFVRTRCVPAGIEKLGRHARRIYRLDQHRRSNRHHASPNASGRSRTTEKITTASNACGWTMN
jgi:homoserine O-acetyltransferase/O-succinyltransferase